VLTVSLPIVLPTATVHANRVATPFFMTVKVYALVVGAVESLILSVDNVPSVGNGITLVPIVLVQDVPPEIQLYSDVVLLRASLYPPIKGVFI